MNGCLKGRQFTAVDRVLSFRSLHRQQPPESLKGEIQFPVVTGESLAACHHHKVIALQFFLVMAEAFAHAPFEAVAIDGPAGLLLGNRQTETGGLLAIGPGEYGEVLVGRAARPLEDLPELAGLQ